MEKVLVNDSRSSCETCKVLPSKSKRKESFEMCCSGKHVLLSNILNVRTIYEKLWQSSSDQSKHKEGAASSL